MDMINYADFEKIDIRVGQIVSAAVNEKAIKPAYILTIDFGELGIKTSSAQITQNYTPGELIGKNVCAVVNFPIKKVAGIKSEVLVLASMDISNGTLLLNPDARAAIGSKIY